MPVHMDDKRMVVMVAGEGPDTLRTRSRPAYASEYAEAGPDLRAQPCRAVHTLNDRARLDECCWPVRAFFASALPGFSLPAERVRVAMAQSHSWHTRAAGPPWSEP